MRPQETRRIVLGVPLSAVAAACIPGVPERRPENSWPLLMAERAGMSFRYPPDWRISLEGETMHFTEKVYHIFPLSNGDTAIATVGPVRHKVSRPMTLIELADPTAWENRLWDESRKKRIGSLIVEGRVVGGKRGVFKILPMGARHITLAIWDFPAWDFLEGDILYFIPLTLSIPTGNPEDEYLDTGTYLTDHPMQWNELTQVRGQLLQTFDRILSTVQFHPPKR